MKTRKRLTQMDGPMSINEAVKQGIRILWREPWSWTSRMELHLIPSREGWGIGPWVKLITDPLEPVTAPLFELDPTESAWYRYDRDALREMQIGAKS